MFFTLGRKNPVSWHRTAKRAQDRLINVYISFGIISIRAVYKGSLLKLTEFHATTWAEPFCLLRMKYHIPSVSHFPG